VLLKHGLALLQSALELSKAALGERKGGLELSKTALEERKAALELSEAALEERQVALALLQSALEERQSALELLNRAISRFEAALARPRFGGERSNLAPAKRQFDRLVRPTQVSSWLLRAATMSPTPMDGRPPPTSKTRPPPPEDRGRERAGSAPAVRVTQDPARPAFR
jgi:hypothetical protein